MKKLISKNSIDFFFKAKDVCHIWELGCGTTFASLLSVFGDLKQTNAVCVVLVVDLSIPETILRTADVLLDYVKSALKHPSTNEDGNPLPRSINIAEVMPDFPFFFGLG